MLLTGKAEVEIDFKEGKRAVYYNIEFLKFTEVN